MFVKVIFVFDAAGEIIVFRIIDLRAALIKSPVMTPEHDIKTPVRQFSQFKVEKFVNRPGIKQPFIIRAAADIVKIGIEFRPDQRIVKHPLRHFGITLRRYRLIFILKITVVAADENRHPPADRRIQFFRPYPPLLDRITEKNLFINIISQTRKISVIRLPQFQNRHLAVKAEFCNQLFFQPLGLLPRKDLMQAVKVKRNVYLPAVDHRFHPVHKIMPVGKTAEVIPNLFVFGMKDMRPVLVNGHAAFVLIIVDIAADVGTPVYDQHFLF